MVVSVYTTPVCSQCSMTKKRFESKNIAFDVIDLEANPEEAERLKDILRERGLKMQAPIVVAGDDIWSGFQPRKIDALAG